MASIRNENMRINAISQSDENETKIIRIVNNGKRLVRIGNQRHLLNAKKYL